MNNIFNEKDIEKKIFDDRWVRFAFGSQGKSKTKNLNLGITEFKKNKMSLTHKHDIDEALYILYGKGTVKIGNRSHKVKTGDFIYVPRGTDHTMITDCESDLKIFFIFSGEITIDH
ncbi:MAG TPA: hypothetical protein DCP02_05840 [Actinobacteria bacterium]|nr:hypothetical protein [Actinomycetota bacterium]